MDLTPNHKLKDLIDIERRIGPPFQRIVTFPEILKNAQGEYEGVMTLDGERIGDPMVAFVMDLTKWGYTNLESFYRLKEPAAGELDTPEPSALPSALREKFRTTRRVRDFFMFEKELPPGVKRTARTQERAPLSKTRFRLPSLSRGPRGFTSAYYGPDSELTAFDAACISAITSGHMLTRYDNYLENIHIDDTKERLTLLMESMAAPGFPPIIEDSGWKLRATSRPERGLHDYERQVTFHEPLTNEQADVYREFLSLDKCPGWTGIRQVANGTSYTFYTTNDSSD